MGIRYTINKCPNCNRMLDYSSNLDLIGNMIKEKKNKRTFEICPYCGEIYKTGFIIDENYSNEEKIKYLENIHYENQRIKDMEFGFYGFETNVNFESEKWVYDLYKYLVKSKMNLLLSSLNRKKIILYNKNIVQIEDLNKIEMQIINNNKNLLLDIMQNLGINRD